MSVDTHRLRRFLAGRVVLATVAVLVVPVSVGALDTRLMTPLALPGYLLLTVGSSVGSRLFPNFAVWVYWAPFLAGSYALAVVTGAVVRSIR